MHVTVLGTLLIKPELIKMVMVKLMCVKAKTLSILNLCPRVAPIVVKTSA